MDFHAVPLQGYILVGAVYAAVYFINAASLGNRMNGLEISDMLNYKKLDKSIDYPNLYQNIGFALLTFGLLSFTFKGESYNFASALFPMLFLTASAYCLKMSFSHWFTKIFIRSTPKYRRDLFYISQLRRLYYAFFATLATLIIGLPASIFACRKMSSVPCDCISSRETLEFFVNIGYADSLGSGVRNLYKYTKIYSNAEPNFEENDVFRLIVPI